MALIAVVAVVLAACGGGDSESTTTTASEEVTTTAAPAATTTTAVAVTTTTTTAATTTTEAAPSGGAIPDPTTGVTLVPYADENVTAGDVFLYWYRDIASGNFVALYAGPGVAEAAGQPLCPGNSIAAPDFMHISNTPAEDGACDGFPTEVSTLQACSGGVWLYLTLIPGDTEGTLFGSLEWNSEAGGVKGLTSQFSTDEDIPDLEYGLSSYTLWEGFTSDGSTEIDCSDPMP